VRQRPGKGARYICAPVIANVPCPLSGALAPFPGPLSGAVGDFFLPYDREWPRHPAPPQLERFNQGLLNGCHGCRMVFRRRYLLTEPAEPALRYYAAGEDWDLSYRISRHGLIFRRHQARLCHLEVGTHRPDLWMQTATLGLNFAVTHRLHSTDLDYSRREYPRLLRRRILSKALKDLRAGRWSLPSARGFLFALRWAKTILNMDKEELRRWYPNFQKELFENRNGLTPG